MIPSRWISLAIVLAALLGAAPGGADAEYLSEADAPKAMFPESTGIERRTLDLDEAETTWVSRTLARRIDARQYPYLVVRRGSETMGVLFVLDVAGQSRPITFAVAIGADGAVREMRVLVYREPQGEQIREARFRRQFVGKRIQDPLSLGRDVDAITGATISSRSATYAVRKALALSEVLRARPSR
jgi:Na+-translocating ferredoxin:NAD+ oxidoreductase RnfG subunit